MPSHLAPDRLGTGNKCDSDTDSFPEFWKHKGGSDTDYCTLNVDYSIFSLTEFQISPSQLCLVLYQLTNPSAPKRSVAPYGKTKTPVLRFEFFLRPGP